MSSILGKYLQVIRICSVIVVDGCDLAHLDGAAGFPGIRLEEFAFPGIITGDESDEASDDVRIGFHKPSCRTEHRIRIRKVTAQVPKMVMDGRLGRFQSVVDDLRLGPQFHHGLPFGGLHHKLPEPAILQQGDTLHYQSGENDNGKAETGLVPHNPTEYLP